jgi:hypothetical protein
MTSGRNKPLRPLNLNLDALTFLNRTGGEIETSDARASKARRIRHSSDCGSNHGFEEFTVA